MVLGMLHSETGGMRDDGFVTGVVTLVQERRFQLADAEGVRHLFVLDGACSLDEGQLRAYADARTRLAVRYRPAPGLVAHLALGIEEESPEALDETRT